jgi:hypothetical protein
MAAVGEERLMQVAKLDTLSSVNGRLPRRYRLRSSDWDTFRFLVHLEQHRDIMERDHLLTQGCWLRFRREFREIIKQRPCAGLRKFLFQVDPDSPVGLVAIWLLGRSATPRCTYGLDQLPAGETHRARRHLARALRRVEAWQRLRELAAVYPNDKFVQEMLARPAHDPFAKRLDRFAQHVDRSHESDAAMASRMPLWFRDSEWSQTPPKDTGWIRVLLERIKRWVRGE